MVPPSIEQTNNLIFLILLTLLSLIALRFITVPNTNARAKEADETLSSDDLGSAATKTGGELVNEPDTNVEGFGTRSLCTSTVNWINVVAEVVEVGGDSVGPVVDIGRISRYQDVPSAVSASSSNVM
jgi:hypothetical protein